MKRNRIERRKHKFRMRNKLLNRIKQDNTLYLCFNKNKLDLYVAKWGDIPTMCSCNMCCNPRHDKWRKERQKLTIQERKALIYDKELNIA